MEHLQENLMAVGGYSKKFGKPSSGSIPIALTADGQPIFGKRKLGSFTARQLKLIPYDDEVERQRRKLAETALA